MKLSVIIPVFNEEQTLLELVSRVEAAVLPAGLEKEIVIVEDCSTDNTRQLLQGLEDRHRVLYHESNFGKGAAIQTGLKHSSGELVVIQDADLEYDPNEYGLLLEPILKGEAKTVFGSRFLNQHVPRYRLLFWGNKFLSLLSSLVFGQRITDMETCYKLMSREVVDKLDLKSNRFNIEPEITAKIIRHGYRIVEVPISYQSRAYSEGKKIGWRDGVSAIYHVLKFKFFD